MFGFVKEKIPFVGGYRIISTNNILMKRNTFLTASPGFDF
jgi:hypothetical protein